eukprot:1160619-Pelagomonas_calceolata.AAC.4
MALPNLLHRLRSSPTLVFGALQVWTSEGNVASDAEKLAKPVLPNTEVALICSAWGNNRTFLQHGMP